MKQQKQSGFAHLMVITVILGLALVGTLGYVCYQNFVQKKDVVSKKDDTSKTKSSATSSPANVDQLVDWKTYVNTSSAFSVKYPSTWFFKDYPNVNLEDESGNLPSFANAEDKLQGNNPSPSISVFIVKYSAPGSISGVTSSSTVTVAGRQSEQVVYNNPGASNSIITDTNVPIGNGYSFQIRYNHITTDSDYTTIYSQMLSTFNID